VSRDLRGGGRSQLPAQISMNADLDTIWKALADETRRQLLDALIDGPKTTTELVVRFPNLSRFGVMKHVEVLRGAGLITTRHKGRSRINSLNALPIYHICARWLSKCEGLWLKPLVELGRTGIEID